MVQVLRNSLKALVLLAQLGSYHHLLPWSPLLWGPVFVEVACPQTATGQDGLNQNSGAAPRSPQQRSSPARPLPGSGTGLHLKNRDVNVGNNNVANNNGDLPSTVATVANPKFGGSVHMLLQFRSAPTAA